MSQAEKSGSETSRYEDLKEPGVTSRSEFWSAWSKNGGWRLGVVLV